MLKEKDQENKLNCFIKRKIRHVFLPFGGIFSILVEENELYEQAI